MKDKFLVEGMYSRLCTKLSTGINLELEILKQLRDDPFVLKLHAAEQTTDFLFLLLEYCQGDAINCG